MKQLVLFTLAISALVLRPAATAAPPNILFIFSADNGWYLGDLGLYYRDYHSPGHHNTAAHYGVRTVTSHQGRCSQMWGRFSACLTISHLHP